jgi:hypothetical protein
MRESTGPGAANGHFGPLHIHISIGRRPLIFPRRIKLLFGEFLSSVPMATFLSTFLWLPHVLVLRLHSVTFPFGYLLSCSCGHLLFSAITSCSLFLRLLTVVCSCGYLLFSVPSTTSYSLLLRLPPISVASATFLFSVTFATFYPLYSYR